MSGFAGGLETRDVLFTEQSIAGIDDTSRKGDVIKWGVLYGIVRPTSMCKSILSVILAMIVLPIVNVSAQETNLFSEQPFLAIWNDAHRSRSGVIAPQLQIAIWNDGRVIRANDASNAVHALIEGRIDTRQITELKSALERTGVFELEGNCYLVPDGPVRCVMLDMGEKEQMLYWDEVERRSYGININPQPHHLKFMETWKEVKKLAMAVSLNGQRDFTNGFERIPQSWRIKRPIQSK